MRLSFRARLTLTMTSLLAGTLVIVGWYAYVRAVRTVSDLSERVIKQTSSLIDQRVGGLLTTAESQSKLLAGLLSPAGPPTRTKVTANQFDRLATDMVEIMRVNPEFGFLSVSIADTGDYLQVVQEPDGSLLIQSSKLDKRGHRRRQDRVPHGGTLRLIHESPRWDFDPRTRPFFVAARKAKEQVWTDTYVFNTDTGPETPGVTCATPVYDAKGRLLAVVTVDFTLGDLSRFLRTISVGQSGYAFLVELHGTQGPRVIAHPKAQSRLMVPEDGHARVASVDELGDKPSATLVHNFTENSTPLQYGEVRRVTFKSEGTRYFGGYQRVTGDRPPNWVMFIVVPTSDFVGGIWEAGAFTLLIGGLALVIGFVASLILARRVAEPLRQLGRETESIRALNLEPRPLPSSKIIEIDQLAAAVEQMKTGLRSFEKLVPAEYARWLMSSGQEAKLGGERRHLTVYFADLVGFTSFSEHLSPEVLVAYLGDYLELLSRVVLDMDGTIDKFNGDDVMAFWGAPNDHPQHALAACKAAIESRRRLTLYRKQLEEEGKPVLHARFGIATGDVVVGNIGSRHRMNYTVIGDAANLASRFQGLNRFYGTSILINDETCSAAGDEVVTRPIDWVSVFGREQVALVFELMALKCEADDTTIAISKLHTKAMHEYRRRRWDEAKEAFEAVLRMRPTDRPARIMLDRCQEFRESPPPDDWDGSHRMEFK